jgi:hypothetical protein
MTRPHRSAMAWLNAVAVVLVSRLVTPDEEDRDRGDVPGWVMITVMTAIVVIALLAVFREQVINAVQNAFQSVTGAA